MLEAPESSAAWAAIDGGEIGPRGRNRSVKHTMSALPPKADILCRGWASGLSDQPLEITSDMTAS